MRKVVIIFLFIVESLLIYTIMFQAETSSRYNDFINAESGADIYKVVLSVNKENASKVYNVLSSLSDKYHANIIVERMKTEAEGNRYTKYVYITRPEYYDAFTFEGTPAYLTHDSNQFLSTETTNDPEQIGRLASFVRSDIFEIRSLKEMLKAAEPFNGTYTIQIADEEFDKFCLDYLRSTGMFVQNLSNMSIVEGVDALLFPLLALAIICIHLIVALVVVYDFAKESKSIAIEKMLGCPKRSIWGRRVFRLLRNQTFVVFAMFVLLNLIFLKATYAFAMSFLGKLALVGIIAVASTLVFSLVAFSTMAHAKIVGMLKNLRPLGSMNAVNMIVKIALLVLVIFLGQNALAQYRSIVGLHAVKYAQWQETRDLYVLDVVVMDGGDWMSQSTIAKRASLYASFNEKGSILADFNGHTPSFQNANAHVSGLEYYSAIVNPNYLEKFPVYDVNGNQVRVSEDETDVTLLIPEGFKGEEAQIRERHQFYLDNYDDSYTTSSGLKRRDQKINIIWVKDEQQYFTYNLSINPEKGNMIDNIILEVLTESNGASFNYDVVMGVIGNPLKIKTEGTEPQNEIYDILKSKGFDGNVEAVVSVYDSVAQEVDESLRMISMLLFAMVVLLLILGMIIIQSVCNYFDKHKRLISIRAFMGHSFAQKYGFYFLRNIVAAWVFIIALSFLITSLEGIMFFVPSLIAAEILTSLLIILVIEKKRIVSTLKGGN